MAKFEQLSALAGVAATNAVVASVTAANVLNNFCEAAGYSSKLIVVSPMFAPENQALNRKATSVRGRAPACCYWSAISEKRHQPFGTTLIRLLDWPSLADEDVDPAGAPAGQPDESDEQKKWVQRDARRPARCLGIQLRDMSPPPKSAVRHSGTKRIQMVVRLAHIVEHSAALKNDE